MAKLALKWLGEESRMFVGRDSGGQSVLVGSWQNKEDAAWTPWRAAKASDLLVIALMACSGYDVVDILLKQREPLTGLTVTAEAEQASDPPWPFTRIHLHYIASGPDLDPKKVERAIKLSEEKYCSVAATIRGVTQITHDFEVLRAAPEAE